MAMATKRERRLRKMLDLYEGQERHHREKGNVIAADRAQEAAVRCKSEIAKEQQTS